MNSQFPADKNKIRRKKTLLPENSGKQRVDNSSLRPSTSLENHHAGPSRNTYISGSPKEGIRPLEFVTDNFGPRNAEADFQSNQPGLEIFTGKGTGRAGAICDWNRL